MIDRPANSSACNAIPGNRSVAEVFLLGQIDFDRFVTLQNRLLCDAHSRADGRISVLVCEHSPIITIGRGGSKDDVQVRGVLLAGQTLDLVEVDRGGGTMLHLPGQLAVYPIVPLEWYGWTVGEFIHRFQKGLLAALAEVNVRAFTRSERHGIWGESGQLVSMGFAVRDWVTCFGAQIHMTPPIPLCDYLVTDKVEHTPMSSLWTECRRPVAMTSIRSRLTRALVEAFGCEQYFSYTGHPLLERRSEAWP